MSETLKCRCCGDSYREHDDGDNTGTRMCSHCFEVELEIWEEQRWERLAERNEY